MGRTTPPDPFARLLEWEEGNLARHGWYSHYVFGDDDHPGLVDAHTHGLDRLGHPDLQIVLPLGTRVVSTIFDNLISAIKAGRRFRAGERRGGVIRDFDVTFADAEESGRPVLRVILPDDEGHLSPAEMAPHFAIQWDGTAQSSLN